MALVQCSYCGKQVSDSIRECPNCGCLIGGSSSARIDSYADRPQISSTIDNEPQKLETDMTSFVLSLIGLIFFWGWTSFFGLPCAIIGLVLARKKRYTHNTKPAQIMSIIAISIQALFFLHGFVIGFMSAF